MSGPADGQDPEAPSDLPSREHIRAALSLNEDPERITDLYAEWADSYDADLAVEGYPAPDLLVRLAVQHARPRFGTQPPDWKVLDAGCGTGLVGAAGSRVGLGPIDGFDLSGEMVEQARASGHYQDLNGGVNLNEPLAPQTGRDGYDLVLCCGVFTLGHVPPTSLQHLLEVARREGLVCFSVRSEYVAQTDMLAVIDALVAGGAARVLQQEQGAYVGSDTALYLVLERL